MVLAWAFLALVAISAAFRESGRGVRALLLAAYERASATLKTTRLGFWIVVLLLVWGFAYGGALAINIVWILAIDVATFVELFAAVALALAGASVRWSSLSAHAGALMQRVWGDVIALVRLGSSRRQRTPR